MATRRAVALAGHTGDVEAALAASVDEVASIRVTALAALERLGVLRDDQLAAGLADVDADVRRRAAELAARHAEVDLGPALLDSDPTVAEAAAWACGERDGLDPTTLDRLIALASGLGTGAEPLVRESAIAALGAVGDDRGLDAILAGTTDRPAIRRRAVLALASFVDPDHLRASEVTGALDRALTDRDWQVRQAAEDLVNSAA